MSTARVPTLKGVNSVPNSTRRTPAQSSARRRKEKLLRKMEAEKDRSNELDVSREILKSKQATKVLRQNRNKSHLHGLHSIEDRLAEMPDTELGKLSATEARSKVTSDQDGYMVARSGKSAQDYKDRLTALREKIQAQMAEDDDAINHIPASEAYTDPENAGIFENTESSLGV